MVRGQRGRGEESIGAALNALTELEDWLRAPKFILLLISIRSAACKSEFTQKL